jgi:hypothetical protein
MWLLVAYAVQSSLTDGLRMEPVPACPRTFYVALPPISQSRPDRRHCNGILDVRFEVFTAVTMKKAVFCDVKPRGSCKNRRFGGT